MRASAACVLPLALLLLAPATTIASPSREPRLILTPARIAELKAARETTHRDLWAAAAASADTFAQAAVPALHDANNRHRTIGDTLPALGLAYRLTGERRFLEAADRWLRALVAVPEWRGSQNLGRSAWALGGALTYDWLGAELPADTREAVRARLVAEGEILLRETSYWRLLSNHCLIETAALGMIGLALEGQHPRCAEFLRVARERADLIIEHAPADGSWGEGIQYWQYGLGYFLRYIEAAKTSGHHDYYPRYAWLRQTGFFPIHFSVPGRPVETVNIADSGMNDYFAGFVFYLPAAAYGQGYFQDYANRTRSAHPYKFSWMDFISYDPRVAPRDYTTLPAFHHFTDNGFVVMRSGWSARDTLVAFHCGPGPGHRNQADARRLERRGFGPGHAHPDINGFSLYAGGKWLVLDPGYVREKWTRQENTILVNGRGQAGEGGVWLDYMAFQNRTPPPRILRADTHPEFDYVIGDAGNVYVDEARLRHFRRHLLFLKPDVVIVLDDIGVSGEAPSTIDWFLHTGRHAEAVAPQRYESSHDEMRLSIDALQPAGAEHRIATQPLRTPATDGTLTSLSLTARVDQRATFLAVLCARRAGEPLPRIELRDGRLEIRHGPRRWRIEVADAGSRDDPAAPLLTVLSR